jgi:putative glycosyltransferase (TIGR04348 family)
MSLIKPHVLIISPATAKANNGNWQTADRWARFLDDRYHVSIESDWSARRSEPVPDAVIALHARRSAPAIASFTDTYPAHPLILALTGTDLYRDIKADVEAQRSLRLATRLVVLQDAGLQILPRDLRGKAVVIYQSAPALKRTAANANDVLDVTMVGHLRDEKDPVTFMRAAALVASPSIRLTHIGGALDPVLGAQAQKTQDEHPRYRWLGELPHDETRDVLKASHVMVIASRMEGGANVIIEAVTSDVPVLASDISGNRGMLGEDYAGYFRVGDPRGLARLIDRTVTDSAFYDKLCAQCKQRALLFSPEREKAALLQLMDNVLAHPINQDLS